MPGLEDHRTKAADCFRRSRQAQDEETRAFFLSMAQLWLVLAQEHVRLERMAEHEINAAHFKQ
jgi:hypothetical protein